MAGRKKQKVGNRYYAGLHLIPCRKADAVLALRMAEKMVWEGEQGQGQINIDKPNAFGGDEREGGFSGGIAVRLGAPEQGVSNYLAKQFGNLTPAYRGIVSLVFRRPYLNANSARMPSMQIKMLNVADIHKGWLPELAVVEEIRKAVPCDISILPALSDDMLGDDRAARQGAAVAGFIRALKGSLNSLQVITVSNAGTIDSTIFDISNDDLYEDVALSVESTHSAPYTGLGWGTNWFATISAYVPAFFLATAIRGIRLGILGLLTGNSSFAGLFGGETREKRRRIFIFVSEGESYLPFLGTPAGAAAVLAAIPDLEVYCFNIDNPDTTDAALLDNTPADGVPVITDNGLQTLLNSVRNTYTFWADMNPAHIQRCLLIDPMRGGTATPDQIGDSFEESAQAYMDEGFGLSVRFSGADANLRDRIEIDRHCDAVTYLSRSTGKWEHRRVREDFDIGDLPVLDGKVVKDWTKLRRPKRRELPNKLTVIYTDRSNGKTASITRSNPVGVRAMGRVVKGQDSRYPFVSNASLAERLCVRDLTAAAEPLLAGDVPLSYLPAGFEIATVVVLRMPAPAGGTEDVPVRITEIRHGAGTDASAWLKVVEQRFDLGIGLPPPDPAPGPDTSGRPRPADIRMVEEAPYKVLVEQLGQDLADDALAEEPGRGRILVAAGQPEGPHLEAVVGVNAGVDWEEEGRIDFSAYSTLYEDLADEGDAIEIRIEANPSLAAVTEGQLAAIGPEIVRVDAMEVDGTDIVMTIGRGCLDTVPARHFGGAPILFFGPGDILDADYLDGESVDVVLLPRTATDVLGLGIAPVDTVSFASRAARPYPPGRLQVNASFEQGQLTEDVTLTWAHRDRRLQTVPLAEDHTATDIGPEAGTTYTVTVDAEDEWGAILANLAEEDVGTDTSFGWTDFTGLPPDTAAVAFSVRSTRDGLDSWQAPRMRVARFLAPADGFIYEVP